METYKTSYNERLFNSWTKIYHLKRFFWLKKKFFNIDIKNKNILELGCFDAKSLIFLNSMPKKYLGLDANWEGGLDIAKNKYKNKENIEFKITKKPSDIPISEFFDYGICMETFEHISPEFLNEYLYRLSQIIKQKIFITIPIERGLAFIIAFFLRFLTKDSYYYMYTFKEILYSIIGKLEKVKRIEHKGFDDRIFLDTLSKYFKIEKVEGIFPGLPIIGLNLEVGIIGTKK